MPAANNRGSQPGRAAFATRPDRNCAGEPTNLFFVDSPLGRATAKAVCCGCPVTDTCLQWALDHNEHGVWGATDDDDRRAIKKGRPCGGPPERHLTCDNCGSPFTTRHTQQRYCKPKCAKAHRETRRQAKEREERAAQPAPPPVDLSHVDRVIVERLLAGEVRYRDAGPAERLEAVRRLLAHGHTRNAVGRQLHISGTTARELIDQLAAHQPSLEAA